MNQIKFRVWDNDLKYYIYSENDIKNGPVSDFIDHVKINLDGTLSFYTDDDGNKSGLWEHSVSFINTRFILEQWTGQLDKNGKEIYEGDRVRFMAWDRSFQPAQKREFTGVVEFDIIASAYKFDGIFWWHIDEIEIISTIHNDGGRK